MQFFRLQESGSICNTFCWSKKQTVFTIVHQQNLWKLKISSIAIVCASLHKESRPINIFWKMNPTSSWHWRVADDCNAGRWFKFAMRLISKRCYLSMSLPTPHGVHSPGDAKILVCLLVLPSQYFPESRFSLNWRILWVSRLTSNEWIAFFLIAMRQWKTSHGLDATNEMDAALAESWTKGIDEKLGQDTKRYF